MSFLVPPSGVEPRSALSDSPLRRVEQLKALVDAAVITPEQLKALMDSVPKCPHGAPKDDCEHIECTVDWVHDL